MRTIAAPWQGFLLAVLVVTVLWPAGTCSGGNATRREPPVRPDPRAAATAARPGSDVTLEAEPHHEGLIVLRSPTFR